jgi:hypothetical protein
MPKVSVAVPHQFDPDQVMERARPYIEKLVEDFEGEDVQLQVTGRRGEFSFKSMMFRINGTVEVDAQQVVVSVDLPFAAMIFKDKVEKAIRKNLTKALESNLPESDSTA